MPHPALPIKRKIIFLFCCNVIFAIGALAQVFTPVKQDSTTIDQLISRFEKKHEEKLASLSSDDYKKIYSLRWKLIREKFDKREVYTNPDAQQYLDALVDEIVSANPSLPDKSFDIFFSRSGNANACYLGEGIILFNMGLFKNLTNESQAVFVICHELAHYYLQHSDENIREYVTGTNNGISKKAARRRSKVFNRIVVQNASARVGFSSQSHRNEYEADSMALQLMKGTRFDAWEAISLIRLFETTADTFDVTSTLQKIFNVEKYPLREEWMAAPAKVLRRVPSSVITHPDSETRIAMLQNHLTKLLPRGFINGNRPGFNEMQKLFDYEIVEYYYTAGNYSRGLFHALEIIQSYPGDPYLTTKIGEILLQLAEASPSQTVGKFIELPSCYQPDNYNVLLNFLLTLKREEFASISYHYLKQHEEQLGFYQPFRNVLNSLSVQIAKR